MADAPVAGDAVLLQLMWLASPALPVGGFSYSEGLEAAVDDGRVSGEASAADWLENSGDAAVEPVELEEAPTERLLARALDRSDNDQVTIVDSPPGKMMASTALNESGVRTSTGSAPSAVRTSA